jgi:hypothetical protein
VPAVKPVCAFCGRLTLHPAVMIGIHPVGPKCAKRHNLLPLAGQKRGLAAPARPAPLGRRSVAHRDDRTPDLFGAAP